jgi:N-acetyl-gamma-glutamyl-phosphate/LysW-gamma-L-alpha-aminoadipyl-6-phosphate reductase
MNMVKVGIIGASGYTGGDLLRLLIGHPEVNIEFASSRKYIGKYIHSVFPNMRKLIDQKFEAFTPERAKQCDVVFLCVPHTVGMEIASQIYSKKGNLKIIDLSADFRLQDPAVYEQYYTKHTNPDLLKLRVIGLPEFHREEIKKAEIVSCYGCLSTTTILGLAPIIQSGLVDLDNIIVETKVGSSAVGRAVSLSTHHPERMGVVRPYKLTGHRHGAEIEQELGNLTGQKVTIGFSAVSTNHVRGVLSVAHTKPQQPLKDKDLWRVYREQYQSEPFVRIVKSSKDLFKLPDPKYVAGSNFCDVGWEIDSHTDRLVIVSAIDNLVKGSGGQALQCMNLMFGLDETTGLRFAGPYP